MKKIKILLALTCCLVLLYATHFFLSTFFYDLYEIIEPSNGAGKFGYIFNIVCEALLFVALISITLGLIKIVKTGFFNPICSKYFKIGGFLFSAVAFGDIIYCIEAIITTNKPELFLQRIFTNVLLLLLGLTSLIVSDILNKGFFLKEENDLTI